MLLRDETTPREEESTAEFFSPKLGAPPSVADIQGYQNSMQRLCESSQACQSIQQVDEFNSEH